MAWWGVPGAKRTQAFQSTFRRPDEVLARLRDPNLLIVENAVATGAGISEILGLHWRHINLFERYRVKATADKAGAEELVFTRTDGSGLPRWDSGVRQAPRAAIFRGWVRTPSVVPTLRGGRRSVGRADHPEAFEQSLRAAAQPPEESVDPKIERCYKVREHGARKHSSVTEPYVTLLPSQS